MSADKDPRDGPASDAERDRRAAQRGSGHRHDRHARRGRPPIDPDERKDKVLHARIPESLDAQLRQEARKMRIPVSNLVRNILEDTLRLVDNVVADSFELVDTVRRDALHIADTAKRTYGSFAKARDDEDEDGEGEEGAEGEDAAVFVAADEAPDEDPESASNAADPGRTEDPLADIYGWQSLRVSREEHCAKCDAAIARGTSANLGQSDVPGAARRWLCDACMEAW
ncbi:MAG: hypothetical protein KC466_03660 [Myxococcales bacterium]|nr:hypothetical protein [Myxococcales bacterium]